MNLFNSDESVHGRLVYSDDEAAVDNVLLSDNEEEKEAYCSNPKKKRIYTPAQSQKKAKDKRQKRAIHKAYNQGVKITQRSEAKEMVEKLSKGEYVDLGSRDDQLTFLQDYLQFDGSHLSAQALAIKVTTTKVLWKEHQSNKKYKKTFKAFHDSAYYE